MTGWLFVLAAAAFACWRYRQAHPRPHPPRTNAFTPTDTDASISTKVYGDILMDDQLKRPCDILREHGAP